MLAIICPHCYALHFDCEKLTSSRVNYPKFGMCCLQGQIQLPPLQPLTGILHNYLTGDDYSSREFHNNIQQYNVAFAMTSVEVKINNSVTRQLSPYCFKIQGELHYLTGAVLPHGNQTPMYAQVYILNTVEQLNVRRANNNNLDPVVIDNLQTMLLDNHPYIGHYCYTYELIRKKPVEEQEEITIRLHVNLQQDQRTHNLFTAEEIAVIIPEDVVHHALDNRDVVLWARGEQLEWISQNSPSYSALHYVLLFPKGENGWHPRIPIYGTQLREQGKNARQRDEEEHAHSQVVSDTCYYAYHLHVRDGPQPSLFYDGKLFQQFVVDTWANYEQRKLNWARTHQHTLRSELYQGLQDATVHDRHDGEDVGPLGCKLILPFSHVGSSRFMTQLFQNAMAICRHFHKPDLFLTMTANPKWPEIIHSLFSSQTATDRPDIVLWVFEQKKKVLLKLIDNGFFGTTVAHIHTIEFQKRGLSYIYLLIFLHS